MTKWSHKPSPLISMNSTLQTKSWTFQINKSVVKNYIKQKSTCISDEEQMHAVNKLLKELDLLLLQHWED